MSPVRLFEFKKGKMMSEENVRGELSKKDHPFELSLRPSKFEDFKGRRKLWIALNWQ